MLCLILWVLVSAWQSRRENRRSWTYCTFPFLLPSISAYFSVPPYHCCTLTVRHGQESWQQPINGIKGASEESLQPTNFVYGGQIKKREGSGERDNWHLRGFAAITTKQQNVYCTVLFCTQYLQYKTQKRGKTFICAVVMRNSFRRDLCVYYCSTFRMTVPPPPLSCPISAPKTILSHLNKAKNKSEGRLRKEEGRKSLPDWLGSLLTYIVA